MIRNREQENTSLSAPKIKETNARILMALLYAFTALFVVMFTLKSIQLHEIFGTSAYDLGIFDQTFWLISRFENAFNTVRGIHAHGDHFSPIVYIFTPFYWLSPSIYWAFLFQSISVGLGAIAFFHIGRNLFPGKPLISFIFSISYLLNPVVHNTILWQYHNLVLASCLYMFLILFYIQNQFAKYLITLVLLLCCREDMPFTLAAIGLIELWQRKWRFAAYTIAFSIIWWLTVTNFVMPYFNYAGYFRHEVGTVKVIAAHIFDLAYYMKRFLFDNDVRLYLWQIFMPLGFFSLLSPVWLFPALPTIFANTMIGSYNTQIAYHYSVNIVPFVYISAMIGFRYLSNKTSKMWHWHYISFVLLAVILALTIYSSANYSKLHPSKIISSYQSWIRMADLRKDIDDFRSSIHEENGVSASDFLVPHLSHRKHIYLFPNPWEIHYWGINGEKPHHPNNVHYIVITPSQYSNHYSLISYLENYGYFKEIKKTGKLLVYKRIRNENPDRERAIKEIEEYKLSGNFVFSNIHLSNIHEKDINQFDKLHIVPDKPLSILRSGWKPFGSTSQTFLSLDFKKEISKSDYQTIYVYAEVWAEKPTNIMLLTGSDDGITVWCNGNKRLQKLILRPAVLGDDTTRLTLRKGLNFFYFRINNAGGSWNLLALIKKIDGA